MPPRVAEGIPGWSFWGQVLIFWVWGVSLTLATAIHLWRTVRQVPGPLARPAGAGHVDGVFGA